MSEDTFYQSLELALDQPVGCLSMSPENRDIVLGARKGLFIVDLHRPYDPPRFLAHSATWDVADIQWSPHPERRSWVASTSSQKALIWNLDLPSPSTVDSNSRTIRSPIQFVLEAHTRAICDINWSVFNVDVLATCAIDSWTYTYDLRLGGKTAVQGFCAWNSPATQVKWNRQDPHILATSHDSRVLVWDTRNPAEPILQINAHNEKIYGIDWSRRSSDGLVTCSLDQTVKFWSTNSIQHPVKTIQTSSPVRRARHLPFGRGVMTLPQRSDHVLKMWSVNQLSSPIASFSGHQDTVREFVWRTRGGANSSFDDRQFQLITWGNDRKLRLWPISTETLKKAGFKPGAPIDVRVTRKATSANRSFRQSNLAVPFIPSPSSMSISPFRSGRASHASSYTSSSMATRTIHTPHPASPRPHRPTTNHSSKAAGSSEHVRHSRSLVVQDRLNRHPGYMTAQATASQLNTPNHRLTWMEGVKLYRPSVNQSPRTAHTRSSSVIGPSQLSRSLSQDRRTEASVNDSQPAPGPQTLGEELTSAQRNFPRITFEQIAVQSRTCSVGLYGPWAARGGIAFLRIMFSFPKSYPELKPPSIEIERSSDVSARTRAFLLKSARELMRDHVHNCKPAAFESCLRFLLGDRSTALEAAKVERFVDSDEEMREPTPGMRPDVLQNNVSVPSPRQAGACFTPEGRLIIFYCGDFRTVQSPQIAMAFPKRNYKFEAFGSLAVTPITNKNQGGSRTGLDEESSESDEALKLPRSRRIRMQSDLVSTAGPLPAREISTLITVRSISMLKPLPIPKLESQDPIVIIDSILDLTSSVDDPVRYRTWVLVRIFILSMTEFLSQAGYPNDNSAVFLEILRYLRGIHDLETLGYVACVMELNRRTCGAQRRDRRLQNDRVTFADDQSAPTTDYFNSKGVANARRSAPKSSPAGSVLIHTPDLPAAAEASQSPSKGSWSTFFLSLTQGASLSNQAGPGGGRGSSSSNTHAYCTGTTPSPDRAVAMLKQQLAGSSNSYHHQSVDATKRDPTKSRFDYLNNDGRTLSRMRPDVFPVKPAGSTPRKRQIIIVKKIPPPVDHQSLQTRRTIDDDPILQAEMEGYKHYLCDILMRRGKVIERAMVVKLLRVPSDGDLILDGVFIERARLLSGLERASEGGVELVLLCPSCGSPLPSIQSSSSSNPSSVPCPSCHRARPVTLCVICHRPVVGLARDCVNCFHGGHLECMSQWWTDQSCCPTGCGCECASIHIPSLSLPLISDYHPHHHHLPDHIHIHPHHHHQNYPSVDFMSDSLSVRTTLAPTTTTTMISTTSTTSITSGTTSTLFEDHVHRGCSLTVSRLP
ncbi:hypothetical protein MJO28_003656 [Puccinia striiformis f. sp. tritici]|uniref:Uncharacterized protein n=1 Tax=Puccinia striiformis f. sp. tritici TaxID=168172 RepID=A0ACC0EM68_9BASI|nr:hypothetical protein Pst134EB_008805 [Puccinia striiformis f. sp. tritici]KAI7956561.1 hypothetical protein MJO28_003656 [Puccinia striiformis f. sp. tritici]